MRMESPGANGTKSSVGYILKKFPFTASTLTAGVPSCFT